MRSAAPLVCILASLVPGLAAAQVDEERLQLMRETTSYTDVADAADGDDPFDLNLRIGFSQRRVTGTIRREQTNASGIAAFEDVGDYQSIRNVLEVGADLGIYHDLALTVRLPVILSDSYSISQGAIGPNVNTDVGGTSQTLFSLPFDGPTRSGIDTLHLGMAWSPLNQNRVHEVPTWTLLADVGVPIGARMRPCNPSAGSCDPGISRGNLVLHFETRISRRHRYVEPYVGLGVTGEIPTVSKGAYRPGGDLAGYQRALPPIVGDLTVGAAFIPWENLPRFQRLVIDLRAVGSYVSNGRDYSPLFDALGTSTAASLATVNCEDGHPVSDPAVDCPDPLVKVPFQGLTETGAYGRIGGRIAIEVQAARYVTFSIGTNVLYQTAYALTSTDVCNANVDGSGAPRPGAVDCVSGVFNPHYRGSIDQPGRRFELSHALVIDLFARAIAQF